MRRTKAEQIAAAQAAEEAAWGAVVGLGEFFDRAAAARSLPLLWIGVEAAVRAATNAQARQEIVRLLTERGRTLTR